MVSVILLAGGKGSRINSKIPKQFLPLAGKPIIMHSLERIDMLDSVKEVIIVCHQEYINKMNQLIKDYMLKKVYKIVPGGNTRQESVFIGLNEAIGETVIIHESARPFVRKKEFDNIIVNQAENCIFAEKINFTVVKGKDKIELTLDRNLLLNVQLPQKFNRIKLLNSHIKAKNSNIEFTDDSTLFFYYNKDVIKIINGSNFNIKITSDFDYSISEKIYNDYILGGE
jgi:2-C-methyl-D-erythritol 4-phosphate cytidylyltransferase